jgi:hypothetical protein
MEDLDLLWYFSISDPNREFHGSEGKLTTSSHIFLPFNDFQWFGIFETVSGLLKLCLVVLGAVLMYITAERSKSIAGNSEFLHE